MNTIKFHPILFSTPMVQEIIKGNKTQTRRLLSSVNSINFCPYGQIGDVLWVRETFSKAYTIEGDFARFLYKTDNIESLEKWYPSIFMPKEACRLFLKITDIRLEQLHNISEEDAQKEGVLKDVKMPLANFQTKYIYRNYDSKSESFGCADARSSFMTLWKSINGEESWKCNPMVWVISFERIEKPEIFI